MVRRRLRGRDGHTLAQYPQEITLLTSGIATCRLITAGRTGLTNGLARVQATKATVDAAFGGGKRRVRD